MSERYTTIIEGCIKQPAYNDDGERVNMICPAKVKVMGTATPVDLYLVIISIYEYLEQIDMIPREKSKAIVEQLEILIKENVKEEQ